VVNAQTTAIEFNRKLGAILHEVPGRDFPEQGDSERQVKRGSGSHWMMNRPAEGLSFVSLAKFASYVRAMCARREATDLAVIASRSQWLRFRNCHGDHQERVGARSPAK